MFKTLLATLKAVGKHYELFETEDGTRLLVLSYGGRLLGVFAPGNDENFLWTNTALENVESARAYYAGDDWQNSGGDRTWLAPELDFFLPDYPKLDRYFQPRQLDPGNYQLLSTGNGPHLTNQLTLQASRTKKSVKLEINKSFGSALNPLRHEDHVAIDDVEYAGHSMTTSLRILDPKPEEAPLVGLWSLTQMPHQGELFIPTFYKSDPKIYFGFTNTPADEVVTQPTMVRFKMRAKGEHKIGVRAAATVGRIGYLYTTGSKSALIVRNFSVNPSGVYADVPWNEPDDRGYSTQACSVNSKWGMFSELEYHVPAIGGETRQSFIEDHSQLWAFRGTEQKIREISRRLLSREV
jgi:hypothetical protein